MKERENMTGKVPKYGVSKLWQDSITTRKTRYNFFYVYEEIKPFCSIEEIKTAKLTWKVFIY